MKKTYFWPTAMVVMGLVILAQNVQLLPSAFMNLWPLILVVVGLGGVLTADRSDWLEETGSIKKSPRKTTKKKKKAK